MAKIAVSAATFSIDKPYDYKIPQNLLDNAVPGMRVIVPFGRGNRKSEGVILALSEDTGLKKLKAIEQLLDENPVLTEENIKLALWMSDRFFCTVFDSFRAMLPAGMWFKDGVRRQGDKTVNIAILNVHSEEALMLSQQRKSSAPSQSAVLELLSATESMPVSDICHFTNTKNPTIKALEKQGIISIESQEVFRRPSVGVLKDPGPITLNDEQQKVFDGLVTLMTNGTPEAALLHGVTGSGKTLVYIKLIEEALERGKTAIVLVPEIALTPQMMSVFTSHFGDAVAVLHSALSVGERYDEWKRIKLHGVRVVVGTRSAIFAPLENLGLIVLDEEQEHTYKSENSPRYHAREIAKYRVSRAGGLLLLGSATPSVESMFNAKAGKYKFFRIENRYNEKELPSVIIADMKQELKNGNGGSISSVLQQELTRNIEAGEQSILFLNRRGMNPLVACGECGFTYECHRCSVAMTYHSANSRLLCHYCGYSLPLPDECPSCYGKLKFIGAGTQKVEAELQELFPGIKVIRMDTDTVSQSNSHDKLLSRFREEKVPILLGTQMVTKGLDFENVTLVGVLLADMSLYMNDYRAHEKTFSLITQVVGRAGRGDKPGRAVIQTFTPKHEVIALASKQDYDGFYEGEIVLRQALGSPPVRDLFTLVATGIDETAVLSAVSRIRSALLGYFGNDSGIKLLGPAPAPVPKVNNRYRYRLLISCENTKQVRDTIAHTIREFARDKQGRGVSVFADSDSYG
ncbi:MAG: primosomal protein N' [Oscillospiraceae bacterium]|nr:primosomal protein N' [Oscillospiraceae bacterium]